MEQNNAAIALGALMMFLSGKEKYTAKGAPRYLNLAIACLAADADIPNPIDDKTRKQLMETAQATLVNQDDTQV